eukprot:TRINITY_DN15263_c0_g1_i1.p1 TRINITY_DN15263_c0_g1~~TRINITY_DN15263_c0_g1_i1.p1  ORF type:complete len:218 (+),score=45.13 TRINITY_DN15263_c0_g1_i1:23-676(+)
MGDEFIEETFTLDLPPAQPVPQAQRYKPPPQQQSYQQPSYQQPNYQQSAYGEQYVNEEDRLNKHIMKHEVGARGQAMLQSNATYEEPVVQPKRVVGAEHWVDLHREFADILDINELQKYRKHFRAFGEKEGFIDQTALQETMETFFGQDLEKRQILETISEIDYDNDGKISYREFLEVMCALKSGDRNRRTKLGNFYKVLTLKNPPWWAQRVGRMNN